jgi:predicted PilT family ATPase
MIRDLQARSSCRIDVDQNVPQGQPRVITYRGTRSQVDFAKRLVNLLCQENASDADLPLGEAKQEYLMVPAQSVGKIIGRSGEMIRELQSRSHAKIQVDHQRHTGSDQKHVTITGSDQSVAKAKEMILFLVANPLMDAMQSINMLVEDKLQRGGVWVGSSTHLFGDPWFPVTQ